MFKKIFVPLDLEEPTSWSKTLPVALAMAVENDASLTLGTVISDWDAARRVQWSSFGYRRMVKEAELQLKHIAESCAIQEYDVKIGSGAIGSSIVDLAELVEADLIVLASHKPGLKDYLIGANALHVVRHAKCSVFVVRE